MPNPPFEEEAMEALASVILMPFYWVARMVLGRHSDEESIFIMMVALMGVAFCIAIVLAGMLTAMWFGA